MNFVQQTHLLQVEKKLGKNTKNTLNTKSIKKRKTKRANKLEKNKQKTTLFKNKSHAKDNQDKYLQITLNFSQSDRAKNSPALQHLQVF